MKKALRKLQSKFVKTTVLNETVIGGTTYRVVEKTSILPWYKNKRAICFKSPQEPNRVYVHSMIYNTLKAHYQPTLIVPQKLIEFWHRHYKPQNALILGAAGCTVPRFIALNFPEMQTVGIEYCSEFIEMANKYFFISQISDRFTLLEGDAFNYVINKRSSEKQDIIFVDVFDKTSIPEELFSEEFLNSLYEQTNEDSLIIFNLLTLNKEKAKSFANSIKAPFSKKILIFNGNSVMLALVKSTDSRKTDDFFREIHIFDSIVEC